jgi:hypothetical protein
MAAAWRRLIDTLPVSIRNSPDAGAGLLLAADTLAALLARSALLPLADPCGVPRVGLLAAEVAAAAASASPAAAAQLPSIGTPAAALAFLAQRVTTEHLSAASGMLSPPWQAAAASDVVRQLQHVQLDPALGVPVVVSGWHLHSFVRHIPAGSICLAVFPSARLQKAPVLDLDAVEEVLQGCLCWGPAELPEVLVSRVGTQLLAVQPSRVAAQAVAVSAEALTALAACSATPALAVDVTSWIHK